jgi:hypothetical protein
LKVRPAPSARQVSSPVISESRCASGSNGRRQKPNKRISQDCVGDGQADGQCELVVVEFRPQEQRGKA